MLCCGALLFAATPERPKLTFDTQGGETWSFDKFISGQIESGVCDEVHVQSPLGTRRAVVQGGRFHAVAPLQEGLNEVRAVCRHQGREVAGASPQIWTQRLEDRPKAWVRLRAAGSSIWVDAGRSERAPARPAEISKYEWQTCGENPAALTLASDGASLAQGRIDAQEIEIVAPRRDGEYCVRLRVTDSLGRSDESAALFKVSDGRPAEIDAEHEHAAWIDAAVIYGIAPYFFGAGNFDAVTERLDEIAALGATAIWLSPISGAAADDFGYAVTDHLQLRNAFGDENSFRSLVNTAHALGLRVLLDLVPNHFSDQSRYYLDVEAQGKRSPYYAWFDRDASGAITRYFDWENLKNLNYDDPEVQHYIIAASAHWIKTFDIDGFRVDAAWAIRERAPEFWARWREELKRIKPQVLLLAEGSAQEPYFRRHGFDAGYDWTAQVGEWSWRAALQEEEAPIDVARLQAALAAEQSVAGEGPLRLHFLNNNDTGARFITRHGVEAVRVAAALLLTLPGIPLIYNGDEVGAEFEPYDEAPPIDWSDKHGLVAWYARLLQLRREHSALRSAEMELLKTDHEDRIIAYRRKAKDAGDDCWVVLNFGDRGGRVEFAEALPTRRMEDLLTGAFVKTGWSRKAVEVEPYSAKLLRVAR